MLTGDAAQLRTGSNDLSPGPFSGTAWSVLKQMRSQENLADALQLVVQQLGSALQVDRCFIIEFHQQAPLPLQFEYRRHEEIASFLGATPPWETCPYLRRTASRQFVAIPDIATDLSIDANWRGFFQEHHIHGMIASPVVYGDETLNVLVLHTETPREWQEDELYFIQFCSDQLAVSLYRSKTQHLMERLQQVETRYELGMDGSSIGIWEWNLQTDATWWNEPMSRLLDCHPLQCERTMSLLGERAHPHDRHLPMDALQRSIRSGQPNGTEFRIIATSGAVRHLALHIMPIPDASGQIISLTGMLKDRTAQREAERALQESENRFQVMADATGVLIAVSDATGKPTFTNQALQIFLGGPNPEGLEKLLSELMDLSRQPDGIPQRITTEHRVRRHDGQLRWLYTEVSPRLNEHGDFLGLIASMFDITDKKTAEQALMESEERFRNTFAYASSGMAIADLSGRLLRVNASFCRILEYASEDELLGKSFRLITHADDVAQSSSLVQQVSAGILPGFSIEKRYLRQDATPVWAKTSVSLVRDHQGKPLHLIALVEDISERKQTEQALLESEERFRRMADSAPLFIWISNPLGKVHYVNKTWTDFLGLPAQDVIDFGMRDAVIPDDFPGSQKIYRDAFSRQEPFSVECRLRRADGEVRWLLNKGAPLYFPNGNLAGYIGTSVDITERKEAEVRQQKSLARERLLRQVVEIINQSFDLGSILHETARTIGEHFGADRCFIVRYQQMDNVLNLTLFGEYLKPGILAVDMSDFPPEMFKILTKDIPVQRAMRLQRHTNPDEYYQDFSERMQALPHLTDAQKEEYTSYFRRILIDKYHLNALLSTGITYRGNPYGVISFHQCTPRQWTDDDVALLQDIATQIGVAFYQAELYHQAQETALKEHKARQDMEMYAKKLEISNRELEQFATIASHDLQEPLRKVQIFSQLVAEQADERGRQDYIHRMQSAVGRMQSLISDLLALSRISRQGQPFRSVHLNRCVEAAMSDLEVTIQEQQPELSVGPLAELEADPQQITQLFQNLIGNSLKFRQPDQAPRITITGQPVEAGCYEITVADNGIGFMEQYRQRIFEPFERLHGRSQKYPGTGMGLTICRKIVERHNGTIAAHSGEGQGATFTITLPFRQPRQDLDAKF